MASSEEHLADETAKEENDEMSSLVEGSGCQQVSIAPFVREGDIASLPPLVSEGGGNCATAASISTSSSEPDNNNSSKKRPLSGSASTTTTTTTTSTTSHPLQHALHSTHGNAATATRATQEDMACGHPVLLQNTTLSSTTSLTAETTNADQTLCNNNPRHAQIAEASTRGDDVSLQSLPATNEGLQQRGERRLATATSTTTSTSRSGEPLHSNNSTRMMCPPSVSAATTTTSHPLQQHAFRSTHANAAVAATMTQEGMVCLHPEVLKNATVASFAAITTTDQQRLHNTNNSRYPQTADASPTKGDGESLLPLPTADQGLQRGERRLLALLQEEQPGAFNVRSSSDGNIEFHRPHRSSSPTTHSCPSTIGGHPTAAAVAVNEGEEAQRLSDAVEQGRQSVLVNAVNAEIVAPQLFTKQNLRMPTFSLVNEIRFRTEHTRLLLSALRIFKHLAIAANLLFILWPALQPDAPVLECAMNIVSTLLVFHIITLFAAKNPHGPVQSSVCVAFLVISTQVCVTMYLVQDGFVTAGPGISAVLIPGSFCLRFWYGLLFCVGTAGISNALAIASVFANNTTYKLSYVLFHFNMFLAVYVAYGIVISYVMELHLRHRFRDTGTIFSWRTDSTNRQTAQESQSQEGSQLALLGETNDHQEDPTLAYNRQLSGDGEVHC